MLNALYTTVVFPQLIVASTIRAQHFTELAMTPRWNATVVGTRCRHDADTMRKVGMRFGEHRVGKPRPNELRQLKWRTQF